MPRSHDLSGTESELKCMNLIGSYSMCPVYGILNFNLCISNNHKVKLSLVKLNWANRSSEHANEWNTLFQVPSSKFRVPSTKFRVPLPSS